MGTNRKKDLITGNSKRVSRQLSMRTFTRQENRSIAQTLSESLSNSIDTTHLLNRPTTPVDVIPKVDDDVPMVPQSRRICNICKQVI